MKLRILTAVLLIPPVVYLIGWSPKWLFLAAVIAAVELCLYEFFRICQSSGFKPFPPLGYVFGAAVCMVQATPHPEIWTLVLLFTAFLLTLLVGLVMASDLKMYLGAVATTIFGVLYIGITLAFLFPLRFSPPVASVVGSVDLNAAVGSRMVLLLFLVIWADDTFAYLVGRTIGRKILFPSISPRKTLEGSLAGFVGSLLVAWGYTSLYWQTARLEVVILLSALVSLFGQIGDLVESAVKRGAGVKDSGMLLPGHGGLLDRLDSLLLGAPVLWLALTILDFLR